MDPEYKFNYKINIEYNGAGFFGSQIQNHFDHSVRTVQGETEKILQFFLKEKIDLIMSSRTDAGVHAIGQVANFKTKAAINDIESNPDKFLISLNSKLPNDLVINKIQLVPDDFHARFSAKSRLYMYKIFCRKHRAVLRTDSLAWVPAELNFGDMQKYAQEFIGQKDYSHFANMDENDPKEKAICNITHSELQQESKICYKYFIESDHFLRNMVRRIVGSLVSVGKGEGVKADKTMPACGLTLMKVNY